ncbi:MAG TPA: ISL3 family transposase [Candidatus Baltobacteraceae bacterium]|nr:ISL3 family transposase [Candidatus Baltobacteraceae bacterium]
MTTNVLNLPQYRVLKVDETEHDYHILTEIAAENVPCPHCRSMKIQRWGTREILFKDLPMHGKRVGMYVRARRLRCDDCARTFQEPLPALAEKRLMTQRLIRWVGQQSLKRAFTSIADEVGVDEGTIRNIFRDYVNELEAQFEVETPTWLGIDEIHIVKPRCVVANIESKTIVNILPDRNKKTVAGYLNALPQRKRVKYVTMDMWTPYRDAARAVLPQANVIVDKFHVLRMANTAMEQIRKGLRSSLPNRQRRGLMHDRFILLKREHELTAQERFLLDNWRTLHPALGEAYRLKEQFFAVYDAPNKIEAARRYQIWETSIPQAQRAAFAPIVSAWGNWHGEILAYFDHPITNAYTESLNSLIRVMNRIGRGYSFEALRAKILFTEGPQKHKTARPKFERVNRREPFVMMRAMSALSYDVQVWDDDEPERNLGVDIERLTVLIETGQFPRQ